MFDMCLCDVFGPIIGLKKDYSYTKIVSTDQKWDSPTDIKNVSIGGSELLSIIVGDSILN